MSSNAGDFISFDWFLVEQFALDEVRSDEIEAGVKNNKHAREQKASSPSWCCRRSGPTAKSKDKSSIFKKTLERMRVTLKCCSCLKSRRPSEKGKKDHHFIC